MINFVRTPRPELGILGTGRMGLRLAAMFAKAGRRVVLGSRNLERAAVHVREMEIPGLSAGTYEGAASADVVLPAIFLRDELVPHLESVADLLEGKLLIDISNPFNEDYSDFITRWDDSSAEMLQRLFPKVRVVGAFKNVFAQVFDQPVYDGRISDVLVTGDDEGAKQQFLALVEGTPFRYLDAGPLKNSRTVERLTLLTGRLGRQLGTYPTMNWSLLGHAQQAELVA
jgi:NADPH-dependent F420 reductase